MLMAAITAPTHYFLIKPLSIYRRIFFIIGSYIRVRSTYFQRGGGVALHEGNFFCWCPFNDVKFSQLFRQNEFPACFLLCQ